MDFNFGSEIKNLEMPSQLSRSETCLCASTVFPFFFKKKISAV